MGWRRREKINREEEKKRVTKTETTKIYSKRLFIGKSWPVARPGSERAIHNSELLLTSDIACTFHAETPMRFSM